VLYAEPDAPRRAFVTPDDRYFDLLWAMRNIGQTVAGAGGTPGSDTDADEAWNRTVGSRDVVVAVVDSGVDIQHPDLAPNVWANGRETGDGREANGQDDDGDGLVDDRMGWDWVQDDNQPLDGNGHGTHVAGTIAAQGNDGTGVVGLSWQASVMALRVLDAGGSGSVSDVIKGYDYAARHGARVVNASLGGASSSRAERDAIAAAANALFVVAAGNDGADNDTTAAYPCRYSLDNILCVAASDQHDRLADFSNYGSSTVDVAAPGVNIASTWPGDRWVFLDGTSMATPHVAGLAVLALAANPNLGVAALRNAILSTVDRRAALDGRVATGGRVNAAAAVAAAAGASAAPPQATTSPAPAPVPQAAPAPVPQAAPAPPSSPAQPSSPPAAPAPPTIPARAADHIPPGLSVAVATRSPLRTAVSRGLRVRLRCSERCSARIRVIVDARTARRLRLSRGRRAVILARARASIARAGALTRSVRLGPTARRRLLRARSVGLTIHAVATDAAGNRRARSTRTVLRAR
jgi:thermitase